MRGHSFFFIPKIGGSHFFLPLCIFSYLLFGLRFTTRRKSLKLFDNSRKGTPKVTKKFHFLYNKGVVHDDGTITSFYN